ncbi:MAG: class I poly(R)-hydroxyalkanoic acid synthase [Pseudomonadota bacterium]
MASGTAHPANSAFLSQTVSNPEEFVNNMAKVMDHSAQIAGLLAKKAEAMGGAPEDAMEGAEDSSSEFGRVADTLMQVARDYAEHPDKMIEQQQKLWQGHAAIWQNAWQRFLGQEDIKPVVSPEPGDRRFKHEDWSANQAFDFLKQSYLFTTRWAGEAVEDAHGLDDHTRHKAKFYVEQIANAVSPTNFAFTNPEVLKLALETNGASLEKGFRQFAEDLEKSEGELQITQTDMDAFAVGENMALSPGKVVFQNDLIQLIQYEPTTKKVYQKPLLIIPPWINKFYILDLNPQKSFIKWAVDQGLTVFVISWVNPDERLAMKTFSDYMHEGVFAACSAIEDATGEKQVSAIGYCIGGTMLSASLAYAAAKGDDRISAATFFTTQVDFEQAGDLKVFVDEEQISAVERRMADRGYMEGARMSKAFNMLRSNDLIWSYVVNNYLKGKEPFPFDLLFWNADPTRMPAATHSYYLRECYLHNNMSQGRMVLDGVKIDLSKVDVPVYNLATREDHIAPLPSAFKLGKYFSGDTRMVVAGSGHIAGVVNPPEANKYQYWLNDKGADTLEKWLEDAEEHPGSWWPDWAEWTAGHSGKMVPARKPGSGKLKPIEDAPGSYVKVRS